MRVETALIDSYFLEKQVHVYQPAAKTGIPNNPKQVGGAAFEKLRLKY